MWKNGTECLAVFGQEEDVLHLSGGDTEFISTNKTHT
jgi:hypothetical protein